MLWREIHVKSMLWHPCLKHIRLCYDPGVLSERMTFYIIKVNYLNKDNIILKLSINLPNILAPLNGDENSLLYTKCFK